MYGDMQAAKKRDQRKMDICKQQSKIVKRHLHAISIHGNEGGRQI